MLLAKFTAYLSAFSVLWACFINLALWRVQAATKKCSVIDQHHTFVSPDVIILAKRDLNVIKKRSHMGHYFLCVTSMSKVGSIQYIVSAQRGQGCNDINIDTLAILVGPFYGNFALPF